MLPDRNGIGDPCWTAPGTLLTLGPPAGRDPRSQVTRPPRRAATSLQRDWVLADPSTELDRFRAYYEARFPPSAPQDAAQKAS